MWIKACTAVSCMPGKITCISGRFSSLWTVNVTQNGMGPPDVAFMFSGILGDQPSGYCSKVEIPRNGISNSLSPSSFNVNSLFLTSCTQTRIYRLISELRELFREAKSFVQRLVSWWCCLALSSASFWWGASKVWGGRICLWWSWAYIYGGRQWDFLHGRQQGPAGGTDSSG